MLARLILVVMLCAFALPALANGPCHDAPTAVMPAMHHSDTAPVRDDRASLSHVCLGCIPPASLAARAIAAPSARAGVARRIVASVFDPAAGLPPALPPPRREA